MNDIQGGWEGVFVTMELIEDILYYVLEIVASSMLYVLNMILHWVVAPFMCGSIIVKSLMIIIPLSFMIVFYLFGYERLAKLNWFTGLRKIFQRMILVIPAIMYVMLVFTLWLGPNILLHLENGQLNRNTIQNEYRVGGKVIVEGYNQVTRSDWCERKRNGDVEFYTFD